MSWKYRANKSFFPIGCFWLWCLSQHALRTVAFFFVFYFWVCRRKGQLYCLSLVCFLVQLYTMLLSVLFFFPQLKRCPEANDQSHMHQKISIQRTEHSDHTSACRQMRHRLSRKTPGFPNWGASILVCQLSPRLFCSENSNVNIHPAL